VIFFSIGNSFINYKLNKVITQKTITMKKIIALMLTAGVLNVGIAVTPSVDGAKPIKATAIMIPVGKTGKEISLADFSKLSAREYEKMANVKLNFFDRMKYNHEMKKLRNSIAEDGTIKNKKMVETLRSSGSDFTEDFHLGGAALGLFLGPIGVLIAYLINDDNKSVRIKWAWLGFAAWLLVVLILAIL
jgi:hypothetical protein